MSALRPPEPKIIAAAVLLGLAGAWLGFAALATLARPGDFAARTRQIETAVAKVEAAPREGGDPSAYVMGAVCREDLSAAAQRLKARLASAAERSSRQTAPIT